jgi:hypothetical protein
VSGYLVALALTLAIEVPVFALLLGMFAGVPRPAAALAGGVVTLITHPLVFLVLFDPLAGALGDTPALLLAELTAWATESSLLYAWLRRDAAIVAASAFIANALSLGVGLILSP